MTSDPLPARAVMPSADLTPLQLAGTELVYEQCFAPHLRVPFTSIVTPSPADLMLVAVEDSRPVGFAALMRLGGRGWTFLRYYGVAANRRRTGVGQWFWQQVPRALGQAGWPARIVFEVEDPRDAADDPAEHRVRTARIAFWQRCGAELLDVDGYVMPDLVGLAAPEPMLLMAYDAGDMPPAELAALVTVLYAERYGLGVDHPLVIGALASISR